MNDMGYAVYKVGPRWGGYGVPAYCEHPDCNEEIDRGMSFACGGEPFSEVGCDRYFCSKHREMVGFKCDGSDELCDHEDDCECEFKEVCENCAYRGDGEPRYKMPFPYKPEHPDWVAHLLTDESWSDWRKENPGEVKQLENAKRKGSTNNTGALD